MSIATIVSISGQAWARDAEGNLRELSAGDPLFEGDTLVVADGARVELDFADGLDPVLIEGPQEVAMTPELDAKAEIDTTEVSASDADLEALLSALTESDEDLLPLLEEPGAGSTGGGNAEGGHDFVRLARIAEDLPPQSFDFATARFREDDDPLSPSGGDTDEGDGEAGLVAGTDADTSDPVDPATPTDPVDPIAPATAGLRLSATDSISEAGGTITYTATLSNDAQGVVTVTLSNGATIEIADGESSGSVEVELADEDDVYVDGREISVTIEDASGGNFEALEIDSTPATTQVTDTIDATPITLSAPAQATEGDDITVTATVDAAPQGSDLVIELSNGETITIAAGETEGSVSFASRGDDLAAQGDEALELSIESANGGNYEALDTSATATVTTVDDADTTTLTLGDVSVEEGSGTATVRGELSAPAGQAFTVTLSNGATLSFAEGASEATSSEFSVQGDDVYADGESYALSVTDAGDHGFEALDSSDTATVTVGDTVATTTVSLAATDSISEAGGPITYTATLTNAAQGAVTVTLDNGAIIEIADGETQGSVDVTLDAEDDAYIDGREISASIDSAEGGNFEDLEIDNASATTQVTDTSDTTTVSLDATDSISEAGGAITYTATLTNAAQGTVTVSLSNGATITIVDGEREGTVQVELADEDDVYIDGREISASIGSAEGGNFEALEVDSTPATTQVTDTSDTTTVSLDATDSISEAGGAISYTATLTNAAQGPVTVTLSNGATIEIADGEIQGSVDVTLDAEDDAYIDGREISVSIESAEGGNFEALEIDSTPATTQVTDTSDTTTLTLGDVSVEEGSGTATVRGELSAPAGQAFTVTLSNGATLSFAEGASEAISSEFSVQGDDVYADGESYALSVTDAGDHGFEALDTGDTATVTIGDTADTTTVSLSATDSISEAGGPITYTATLTNAAQGPVTVTLDNGATIEIADGETQGSVDVTLDAEDDVYSDGREISVSIESAEGGNFEALEIDSAPATTQVTDTVDATPITLSAPAQVTEGDDITVTASVDAAPQGSDLVIDLSNGQQITIAAGETEGSVSFASRGDDLAAQGDETLELAIESASGGNYEALDTSATATVTTVDDGDTTTLTLGDVSIEEGAGTATVRGELSAPAGQAFTVTLSNGATLSFAEGASEATSSEFSIQGDDVYADGESYELSVSDVGDHGFEALDTGDTATVTVSDTSDTTTVSLSATDNVSEAGGPITYTASLTNAAQGDVTITLSNGATITIADGESSGSVEVELADEDDAYIDGREISVSIDSAEGGNFEALEIDGTPATTQVTDTSDTTTVSLAASEEVSEAGGTITYTATLSNAAQGDVTIALSNGATITIADGESSGSVEVELADEDDVYVDGREISVSIDSAEGGNFEALEINSTPATTQVTDTSDTTTLSLGDVSVEEGSGTATVRGELSAPAGQAFTVTLSNGATLSFAEGASEATSSEFSVQGDDVYQDGESYALSVTDAGNHGFEALDTADTATVTVTDTVTTTTVSLAASEEVSEAGGTITYTATLTNAAQGDVTVALSNGETITIADGETQGSVDVTLDAEDDVYVDGREISAAIESVEGGNFEDLQVDSTPATTQVTDTVDAPPITLSAPAQVVEGDDITVTASVEQAPQGSDLVIELSNGQQITIAAGELEGSVSFASRGDDLAAQGEETLELAIESASGGNYEALDTSATATVTTVDDGDTTTLTLGDVSVAEGSGTATVTGSLSAPAGQAFTVMLSNGATLSFAEGASEATSSEFSVQGDDVYADGESYALSVTDAGDHGFEALDTSDTAQVTVTDTVATTTVSLSASEGVSEAGGTITYTATLTNAAQGPVTVALSNGATITIAYGESSGSVEVELADEDDVYVDGREISVAIESAEGGNFEALEIDSAPVTTQVTDTTDTSTVSLAATDSISEAGGTITYTASLTNAAQGDVTVALSNGETITIADGEIQGSIDVTLDAEDDTYVDGREISVAIESAEGGNFEALETDGTPATTQVADTVDATPIVLSAPAQVTEGDDITVTASVDAAPQGSDLVIELSNGEMITITAGELEGSVSFASRADDLAAQGDEALELAIESATGGNYEALDTSATATVTTVDDADTTTVSLDATDSISEAGGTITYTATLTNAAQGPVTVTLSNGAIIEISDGESSGSIDVLVAADEDAYQEADNVSVSIDSAEGGNFENLQVDDTPAITQVTDTSDTTTVSLAATDSVSEAGGAITYTASLTNAAQGPVTVALSNGATITIADGERTGSVNVELANEDDTYIDGREISVAIESAEGGNFEALEIDGTPATTQVADTVDATPIVLSAPAQVTEGDDITVTASVDAAPQGSDLVIELSNGEMITITAGELEGSVSFASRADDLAAQGDEALALGIESASGGNFEALDTSATATVTTVDDADTTTLTLGDVSVEEGAGTATVRGELSAPAGQAFSVTLSNGATLSFAEGASEATSSEFSIQGDDVYADGESYALSVTDAGDHGFEALDTSDTATVTISDTIDATPITLSAPAQVTEGQLINVTASVEQAPQGSDLVIALSNGETITIAAGELEGSVSFASRDDDLAAQGDETLELAIESASGGNYEALDTSATATVITVDDADTTTLTLDEVSVEEGSGTATVTGSLSAPAGQAFTVTLSNGATLSFAAGASEATSSEFSVQGDDVYADSESYALSVSDAGDHGFEALDTSDTATVTVGDTVATTTVRLSASADVSEAGGPITYAATLTNAAQGPVTVTLSNGETITIADGETHGSVDVELGNEDDAYLDSREISVAIEDASGGNFEDLQVDETPATTQVTNTSDTTTVSLDATDSISEAGGTLTYTATLTNAAQGAVAVTLSNGATIEIADGETQGSVDVTLDAEDDTYVDGREISETIESAEGGNFEDLQVDSTPATTQVTDTADTTTVSLAATDSVSEAGGPITYTATLTNAAQGPVTVALSNGATIEIADGETVGTAQVELADEDDAYIDGREISATIDSAEGGNFEALEVDSTPATTQVTDTVDATPITLSTPAQVVEGEPITVTASVNNAPQGSDLVIELSNGQQITIAAGELESSVSFASRGDDLAAQGDEAHELAIESASGGNYEALDTSATATVTTVDDADTTTLTLSDVSVSEGSGTATVTGSLSAPAAQAFTVTLSNGATLSFAEGAREATSSEFSVQGDDVYADGESYALSVNDAGDHGFESLDTSDTATVTVGDTTDTSIVSLSATDSISEAGGTLTYTATLTNAAQGTVTVTLSNGETITIADGESSGSVEVELADEDDAYIDGREISATIESAEGGNFEDLQVDTTPATTQVIDTLDATPITLSAPAQVVEGEPITVTASVDAAPQGSDLVIELSNGQQIIIAAGEREGSVSFASREDDLAAQGDETLELTIESASGGNYEALDTSATATVTTVDDADTTTLTLNDVSVEEGAGTATVTGNLSAPAVTAFTVTLSNGATLSFAEGASEATSSEFDIQGDDVYQDGESYALSVSDAGDHGFEVLDTSDTAQVTIGDTVDATLITLSAPAQVTEGEPITVTASVDAAPQGSDLVIELSNGETITIAAGETEGSVSFASPQGDDDSLELTISNASGGNYEAFDTGDTASIDIKDPDMLSVGSNADNAIESGSGNDVLVGDKGGTDTVVQPGTNYNISLIIDTSGSMDNASGSGMSRMELARNALKNLAAQVVDHDGQINLQLVDFASGATSTSFLDITNADDALAKIEVAIDDLEAGGGTNYEAGFNEATDWFNSLDDDYQNLTYFLTDGNPTYYLNDWGAIAGPGSTTTFDVLQNSVDAFASLSGVSTVQGIGIGNGINEKLLQFFDTTSVTGQDSVSFGWFGWGGTVSGPVGEVDIVNTAFDLEAALQGGSQSEELAEAGDDLLSGGEGDDILLGDAPNTDQLAAEKGIDMPAGSGWEVFRKLEADWSHDDTLAYIEGHLDELGQRAPDGREGGDDVLIGGAGDDVLFGQEGADVFKWEFGDQGDAGAPARDVIKDFSLAEGDVLDIGGLLEGESGDSLGDYLFAEPSTSGSDTILHVSSDGGFANGYTADAEDQTIVLEGVSMGDAPSDSRDFLNELIQNKQLTIDG